LRQNPLHSILWLALAALVLAACSTTEKLPDDEQLYVGIKSIDYTNSPVKSRKVRRDSVGVITTISDAAHAIDDALSGHVDDGILGKLKADAQGGLTKEEEKIEAETNSITKSALETAKTEVEAVLAYPPNNALFGSSYRRSPLQLGLWFYNGFVDAKSKFGKWIYKCFAQQPIYISSVSPNMRAKIAENTLQNYGFFNGRVSYEVLPQDNPKKGKIKYFVNVGPLTRFDSIAYLSYGSCEQDSLLAATSHERLLKSGNAFSVVDLSNERTRIGSLFRENGFYFWQDAYTTYLADTIQRKNWAQMRVQPKSDVPQAAKHTWYIGDTYIAIRRSEFDRLGQNQNMRDFHLQYSGERLPLRFSLWRQGVTHRHGEIYRYKDQKNTVEKLNNIGVFSQLDVNYVARDTTAFCDTLDIYISALMDKRFDSNFEMNATLKSNQQVGPGLSYTINKKNAFRGGEKMSFKVFGSYEWQFGWQREASELPNSYELGAQWSVSFPRFFAPLISKKRLRFPAETTIALNVDWKRRADFYSLINAGVSALYNWHKRSNQLHELAFGVDFTKTIDTTEEFDSILDVTPTLEVTMRDQFVPYIGYTYTFKSPATWRNPLILQLSAKEAGNVLSGVYAAAGKSWTEKYKKMFGSPFAQFVKTTAELRYTVPLTSDLTLATRFYGGVIWAYGNSDYAPYSEWFYVGGANSIRGFMVRSIGPGHYKGDDTKYAYIDQTGDVRLEVNAELRAHLFGSLYGAVFLDAGNVWLLKPDEDYPGGEFSFKNLKDIAVGTGFGLRYDLQFLVLRLDLGIGLHAPYETSKSGFFNLEKFKDALNLHFAIGYPF